MTSSAAAARALGKRLGEHQKQATPDQVRPRDQLGSQDHQPGDCGHQTPASCVTGYNLPPIYNQL